MADWITVPSIAGIAVCVVFIIVGHLRRTTPEDFYLGHKQYITYTSAMSIVAAFTGGSAFLNTTALAERYGYWAFFDVFPAVGGLFVSFLLALYGIFSRQFSNVFFDVGTETYNKKAVTLHYIQVTFLYLLVIAAQFRAVATFAEYLGIHAFAAVVVVALAVGAYAFRGFGAITRTDVLQLILMMPMYIALAVLAGEPRQVTIGSSGHEPMPWSLAMALCLPFFFLPISQELHQRGASSRDDKSLRYSYLLAGIVYLFLASAIVIIFSYKDLSISSIIRGKNIVAACIVTVAVASAIMSTLDTATNIASHAAQKLRPFRYYPSWAVQAVFLAAGAILYLFFPTVLSLILFAMFVYMSGPALTFLSVYLGLRAKTVSVVNTTYCGIHAFIHFEFVERPSFATVREILPTVDPIPLSLLALVFQLLTLLLLGIWRRFH